MILNLPIAYIKSITLSAGDLRGQLAARSHTTMPGAEVQRGKGE